MLRFGMARIIAFVITLKNINPKHKITPLIGTCVDASRRRVGLSVTWSIRVRASARIASFFTITVQNLGDLALAPYLTFMRTTYF